MRDKVTNEELKDLIREAKDRAFSDKLTYVAIRKDIKGFGLTNSFDIHNETLWVMNLPDDQWDIVKAEFNL